MKIEKIEIEIRTCNIMPDDAVFLVGPGTWESEIITYPDGHEEVRETFHPEHTVAIWNIRLGDA